MNPFIVTLVGLILCNAALADSEGGLDGVVSFDKHSSADDLYKNIRGLVDEFSWETVEVRVFVQFPAYAYAQNGCSWARAQGQRVFSGHTVGDREWDCVVELITNDLDAAELEKTVHVIGELETIYGGSASDWAVGGKTTVITDENDG